MKIGGGELIVDVEPVEARPLDGDAPEGDRDRTAARRDEDPDPVVEAVLEGKVLDRDGGRAAGHEESAVPGRVLAAVAGERAAGAEDGEVLAAGVDDIRGQGDGERAVELDGVDCRVRVGGRDGGAERVRTGVGGAGDQHRSGLRAAVATRPSAAPASPRRIQLSKPVLLRIECDIRSPPCSLPSSEVGGRTLGSGAGGAVKKW